MKTFPELHTKRLHLKRLSDHHAQALLDLRSDARVNQFIRRDPPKNIQIIKTFISDRNDDFENNKLIYWAICKKDQPELIGTCCLWNFNHEKNVAEVGYELHPEAQGKGLMTEAIKAILDHGFNTLHFNMIEAIIHEQNVASQNLVRRFGFEFNETRIDGDIKANQIFEKYA